MLKKACPTWGVCLALVVLGWQPAARAQVLTAGNGFYNVHVNSTGNIGQYTATTGPQHPSGSGLNVLFGSGSPGTSFSTIRSFSSNTDYVQRSATSGNTVVNLGPLGTVTPLLTTGFRTTYSLTNTPDRLTIIQDLKVNGDNFSNSTIEVSTTVQNDGTNSVSVGVRYFWDYQVASDDGPTFQQVVPNGPILATENQFDNPLFVAYRIEDNDVNATPPTFSIFGTVNGPNTISPLPTRPTRLQYASWPSASGTAFDYTTVLGRPVALSGLGNDSAVIYYFGNNSTNALVIPPGGERKVSVSLFLTPPGFTIPGIEELPCEAGVPDPQATHAGCITRDARYWFSHPYSEDPNCATLVKALATNGGGINLGFICLPVTFRNADNVADEFDALIEALGFYARNYKKTGEEDGTQSYGYLGSKLCRERKRLAQEIIAATANLVLLGTDPSNCAVNGTAFPSDLLAEAVAIAESADVDAVRSMTTQLRSFNSSGVINNFDPNSGLVECSPMKKSDVKKLSRDATSQLNCPGLNTFCATAEQILHFPFKTQVDLDRYFDTFASPVCGEGTADAIWSITPPVAAVGRSFFVETEGSSCDTVLSVYEGTCDGLTLVTCNDDAPIPTGNQAVGFLATSQLVFTADGTNSYYIVATAKGSSFCKIKLKVESY